MKKNDENQILAAVRRSDPKKKRVTFFITEDSKNALASWCEANSITESGAVEEMVRATVPDRYFQKGGSVGEVPKRFSTKTNG